MGQKVGKGYVVEAAEPLVNLPQATVQALWKAFTLNTQGWGLDPATFYVICGALRPGMAEEQFRKLFDVFDTDKNDLVDALEFLATVAALSGMELGGKLGFIFQLHDFSETGELLMDEVTLLLKSTVVGLSKVSNNDDAPSLEELEGLAKLSFKDGEDRLSRLKFLEYSASNPTLSSWLEHFDDLQEAGELPVPPPVKKERSTASLMALRGAADCEWPSQGVSYSAELLELHKALKPPGSTSNSRRPDTAFKREWVYGYNGGLFYTAGSDFAYATAQLGVLCSRSEEGVKQQYMAAHSDAVSCLASSDKSMCSGDQSGRLVLWAEAKVQRIFEMGRAVSLVEFSTDGKFLAVVDTAKLTVLDLTTGGEAVFGSTEVEPGLKSIAFALDGLTIATAGTSLHFWLCKGKKWTPKRGVKKDPKKRVYTAVLGVGRATEEVFVSASSEGELAVWHGRGLCTLQPEAHASSISCLSRASGKIASCGADGRVKLWTLADGLRELQCVKVLDTSTAGVRGSLTACCLRKDGLKVLVGTADQAIFEVSVEETEGEEPAGAIVQGPSATKGKVAASGSMFVVLGEDAFFVFELSTRKLLHREQSKPTALAFDAGKLAIAVEDRVEIYTVTQELCTLEITVPDITKDGLITELRFSSTSLAVGFGSTILVMEKEDDAYVTKVTISLESPLRSFDLAEAFDDEPPMCQVGTVGNEELLFFSLKDGSSTPATSARKATWLSETTPTARVVSGVPGSVACLAPSQVLTVASSAKLAVAADPFGAVHVFNQPVIGQCGFATLRGHSSPVVGLAFAEDDDQVLLLTSGEDGVTCWRVEFFAEVAEEATGEEEEDEEEEKTTWVAEEDPNLADPVIIDDKSELFKAVRDDDYTSLLLQDEQAPLNAMVKAPPRDDLALEWVHGYSAQSQRNNVRYNSAGDVVYPAACVGIVLSKELRTQKHSLVHSNEITALATLGDLTATASLCATSKGPQIALWDSVTTKTIKLTESSAGGKCVSSMALSPCGFYLAAVDCDAEHTLNFFDVRSGSKLASAPTGSKKALATAFSSDLQLLVGAVDSFSLWDCSTVGELAAAGKRGVFGSSKRQSVFTAAWLATPDGETPVIGGSLGAVFKVEGRAVVGGEKQHLGPVSAMCSVAATFEDEENPVAAVRLITGGHDGKLKLFSADLEVLLEFDLAGPSFAHLVNPGVASVSVNDDRRKLLIGTMGSEILELSTRDGSDLNDGVALVTGHCAGRLSAVACHPILHEVATVGEDMTLRIWGLEGFKSPEDRGHRELRKLRLEAPSRAADFSPNGHLVACGLCGVGPKAGTVLVVSTLKPALEIVKQLKMASAEITAVKFSPDGSLLAAASQNGQIYVYDTLDAFSLRATLTGHTEPACCLDFSVSSELLHSCTRAPAYETLTHKARTGALATETTEEWHSCTLTSKVGPLPAFTTEDDLLAADRSAELHAHNDGESAKATGRARLLALADDAGRVSVMRWPSSAAKHYAAHAARVGCLRFTPTSDRLASVGEKDRCLVVWRRLRNGDLPEELPEGLLEAPAEAPCAAPAPAPYAVDWRSGLLAPANPPAPTEPAPAPTLRFAYGLPTPQNAFIGYNWTGELVYNVGRLAVVYEKARHSQRFYEGCSSEISAMALDSAGKYAVVAEKNGSLQVFEAATCCFVAELKSHLKSVTKVAIGDDGLIAAVGDGGAPHQNATALVVYSGRQHHVATTVLGGEATFLKMSSDPACEFQVVVGGPDLQFFSLQGRNLVALKAQTDRVYTTGATVDSALFASSGEALQVWTAASSSEVTVSASEEEAHFGDIESMTVGTEGRCLTAGSSDGWVKVWSQGLTLLATFRLPTTSALVALAVDASFTQIAALTRDSVLYETVCDSGAVAEVLGAFQGGEVTAASATFNNNLFACVTSNGFVQVYDAKKRLMVAQEKVADECLTCVAWKGSRLAVGTATKCLILDYAGCSLKIVCELADAEGALTCLGFSPDGLTLACGSADACIYLYTLQQQEVEEGQVKPALYGLYGCFRAHNLPLVALDFCVESKLLRSQSDGVLCCAVADASDVTQEDSRDVAWETHTIKHAWETMAVHSASSDVAVIASNKTQICCGTENGELRLHGFPATSEAMTIKAHAHEVKSLNFFPSTGDLLSASKMLLLHWS